MYVSVRQRYPERGNRSAINTSSAVHDAVMAAAVSQTGSSVAVAAANALARCHRGRHIFQNIQRGVVHALVVILIVELLLSGECPNSLRGLPDAHP